MQEAAGSNPASPIPSREVGAYEEFIKKYQLPFPLLADVDKEMVNSYGVWVEKSLYGKKYMGISRSSFLIDTKGKVEKVWEKVNTKTHAQDVLKYIVEQS